MERAVQIILENEARDSGLQPDKQRVNVGQTIRNAERTSDEKAAIGGSWKQFWKIFAADDYPLTCSFCGEPLSEEDIDGCHIEIKRSYLFREGEYYLEKKYIIPGHHSCNMQLGDEFKAQEGILAIEAIEKED